MPSSAVRNAAIYVVGAREGAQRGRGAAFASNGTFDLTHSHVLYVFRLELHFRTINQCIEHISQVINGYL